MKVFAERFKELREDKKLSHRELAEALGVGNATISYWENGKYEITAENLIKVAKYFNVTTDWLLGLQD